jgi:hypothetical protein
MRQTTPLLLHATMRVSSSQLEWINNQAVNRSKYLRQLIDADMAKHQSKPLEAKQGAR